MPIWKLADELEANTRNTILNRAILFNIIENQIWNNAEHYKKNYSGILKLFDKYSYLLWKYRYSENKDWSCNYEELSKWINLLVSQLVISTSWRDMPICTKEWNLVFSEYLTTINLDDTNLEEYLQIMKFLKLDNLVFYAALIRSWDIKWNTSINCEFSVIKSLDFEDMISSLWSSLKNRKEIIIELLENEKPEEWDNLLYIKLSKLIALYWFEFALDDIKLEELWGIINKRIIGYIQYVKIDWDDIRNLYSEYINAKEKWWELAWENTIKRAVKNIIKIKQKWIKIIAEYTENKELYDFYRNKLWINFFQWDYTKELMLTKIDWELNSERLAENVSWEVDWLLG